MFSGRLGYQEDRTNVRTPVISWRGTEVWHREHQEQMQEVFQSWGGVGYRQNSVVLPTHFIQGSFGYY